MPEQLEGKTAIITGGGRGYGECMGQAVAGAGANVVLTSRTLGESEAVARGIVADGGAALAVRADVTDEASVEAMVEAAVARFGGVDILVNNAGHPGSAAATEDLSVADWRQPHEVNVVGSFICSKAVLPSMTARGGGHIVNVSSATARIGHRFFRSLPYTVTKFAIEGMSYLMSVRLEPLGVRVNAFVPGLAHTRFLDDMPPGFLKGRTCQTVDHVKEPMIHLLTDGVPTGESFEALAWLEQRGKLEQYCYTHD